VYEIVGLASRNQSKSQPGHMWIHRYTGRTRLHKHNESKTI